MNWDAISAIAESIGTLAVLITLLYLAVQLRTANKQREIESLRHNWDGLNQLCELLSESPERASIVIKGRNSLDSLSSEERMIFEFIHLRILNTIEAWYLQLIQTSPEGEYRDQQLRNLSGVMVFFFQYRGAQALWETIKHMFEPIQSQLDDAIAESQVE